jgi:hypothetical protein
VRYFFFPLLRSRVGGERVATDVTSVLDGSGDSACEIDRVERPVELERLVVVIPDADRESVGAAHLVALVGDDFVIELVRGAIVSERPVLIFHGGIVYDRLAAMARKCGLDQWSYVQALQRVVERLAERGHGGIVVVDADSNVHLSGGQLRAGASSLRDAVRAAAGEDLATVRMEVWDEKTDMTAVERAAVEAQRPLQRAIEREIERREVFHEATTFAADLASVDGALILGPDLTTMAFGAHLVAPEIELPSVLAPLGTRHKSAARFCLGSPGAVTFVVSEDGPIAVMHRPLAEDALLVWRPVALKFLWPYDQQTTVQSRVAPG